MSAEVVIASSPAEATAAAHADAVRLEAVLRGVYKGKEPADLGGYKYFWFSTREPKLLANAKIAFQFHLNLLSKYGLPVTVNDATGGILEVNNTLWRVDTDRFKWSRTTLENARFIDPFFHRQVIAKEDTRVKGIYWPGGFDFTQGKEFKKGNDYEDVRKKGQKIPTHAEWLPPVEVENLRKLLYTEVPIIHAEWFLAQSSRQLGFNNKQNGLGYADFLQFKDRDEWFKIVRFIQKDSEDLDKEIRAAQEISGVSPAGRQLVQFGGGPTGKLWVALDTNDATENTAVEQIERGAFKHQIEEWYAHLPNGLPLLGLFNDKGVRQNNAPADVAGFGDRSDLNESKDTRIHLGTISCLRCHAGQVLRDIDDHVRKTKRAPLALSLPVIKKEDKDRFERLQSQYFSNLEEALEEDRSTYQKAFRLATRTPLSPKGLPPQKAVEVYARAYHAYADDVVTTDDAARELGVAKDYFIEALKWQASLLPRDDVARIGLNFKLDGFIGSKPVVYHRLTWERAYPEAHDILVAYTANKRKGEK